MSRVERPWQYSSRQARFLLTLVGISLVSQYPCDISVGINLYLKCPDIFTTSGDIKGYPHSGDIPGWDCWHHYSIKQMPPSALHLFVWLSDLLNYPILALACTMIWGSSDLRTFCPHLTEWVVRFSLLILYCSYKLRSTWQTFSPPPHILSVRASPP